MREGIGWRLWSKFKFYLQIQGNGIDYMDNKNPPKIESKCEERVTALEDENKTLKMEIEILKKVKMLEEKSLHTQNWLSLKSLWCLVSNILVAFFNWKFLRILA